MALERRKFFTSRRPMLKIKVDQSWCSPNLGSSCSYRQLPSKRARAWASLGKWAGTQSTRTPMPWSWHRSTKKRKSSGVPNRLVGA